MAEPKKERPLPKPLLPPADRDAHWVNMQARGFIKGTERFNFEPGIIIGKTAPLCVFYLVFMKRSKRDTYTETSIKCIAFEEVAEWIVANLKYGDMITIVRAEPFMANWSSKTGKFYSEVQWNVLQIDVEDYATDDEPTVPEP